MDRFSEEGPGDMARAALFRSSQDDGCDYDDIDLETGCTPAEMAAEPLTGGDLLYVDDCRVSFVAAQIVIEQRLTADLASGLDAILGHPERKMA